MCMWRRHTNTGICVAVGCAVVALFGTASAQTARSGDAIRGKQLYYDHGCYGCHGFNGETGALRLVGTGSPTLEQAETFIAFLRLRADLQPLLPSMRMPSFPATALSDAEALDIYSFVRTFSLNAPDADRIPAFQAILESAKAPCKP